MPHLRLQSTRRERLGLARALNASRDFLVDTYELEDDEWWNTWLDEKGSVDKAKESPEETRARERKELRELPKRKVNKVAYELGILPGLCQAIPTDCGRETLEAAINFFRAEGATSLFDVGEYGLVDDFMRALTPFVTSGKTAERKLRELVATPLEREDAAEELSKKEGWERKLELLKREEEEAEIRRANEKREADEKRKEEKRRRDAEFEAELRDEL